jgi:hypothetical protein
MNIDETDGMFRQLSRQIFERQKGRWDIFASAVPRITAAAQFYASCRSGRFPARNIDLPLQDVFGDISVLDHPYMTAIGSKIGFPLVDWDTLDTRIVTSYNRMNLALDGGVAKKRSRHADDSRLMVSDSRYEAIFARGHADQILVKDA